MIVKYKIKQKSVKKNLCIFSMNQPLVRFSLYSAISNCLCVCVFELLSANLKNHQTCQNLVISCIKWCNCNSVRSSRHVLPHKVSLGSLHHPTPSIKQTTCYFLPVNLPPPNPFLMPYYNMLKIYKSPLPPLRLSHFCLKEPG